MQKSFVWFLGIFVVIISWALGGRTSWGPWAIGGSGLGLLLFALIRKRKFRAKRMLLVTPWILLLGLSGFGLMNPSFEPYTTSTGHEVLRGIEHNEALPTVAKKSRSIKYLVMLAGLMALGSAVYMGIQTREEARKLLSIIFVNGVVLAVLGTLFHFLKEPKILGLFEPVNAEDFSSFRYKNHWAAFAILCLSVGIGMAIYYFTQGIGILDKRSPTSMFLFPALLLPLTLPLSASRSGIVLLFVLLSILLFLGISNLFSRKGKSRFGKFIGIVAAIVVALGITWLYAGKDIEREWQYTMKKLERNEKLEDLDPRFVLARDTTKMAMDKKWFGWGLGSYIDVFPVYQSSALYRRNFQRVNNKRVFAGWYPVQFEFAHNDYLQYWAEIGIIGCLLLVSVPLWFSVHAIRHGIGNPISFWLSVGCGLVLLMALFEFPLGNPAVFVLFTVMYALSCKYAILTEKKRRARRKSQKLKQDEKGDADETSAVPSSS